MNMRFDKQGSHFSFEISISPSVCLFLLKLATIGSGAGVGYLTYNQ